MHNKDYKYHCTECGPTWTKVATHEIYECVAVLKEQKAQMYEALQNLVGSVSEAHGVGKHGVPGCAVCTDTIVARELLAALDAAEGE